MRVILLILLALSAIACGRELGSTGGAAVSPSLTAPTDGPADTEMETDAHVLSPEQESQYFKTTFSTTAFTFRFAQTKWAECSDQVTGNYTGAKCTNNRGMSVMLKTFMDAHMHKCVDKGLAAQGGGRVEEFHIVHAGIFGDPNHSPRSLHSENRAIDIKSLEVKLTSGSVRNFVYEGTANRAFYTAFRKCWGEIVHTFNGCPYASGVVGHTGSIGWENKDHQHHMHTSIPYCVSGNYGPYYYQR